MSEVESTAGSLTPRQAVFVREYCVDLNASRAAIAAGYSPESAAAIGSQNLTKLNIAAAIEEHQAAKAARVNFTADSVFLELARLTQSDHSHYVAGAKGLELAPGAPKDAMRAVKSCKIKRRVIRGEDGESFEVQEVEFSLHDKNAAIKTAAQHLGMLVNRVEHSGGIETRNREMTDEQLAAAIAAKQAELERHAGG